MCGFSKKKKVDQLQLKALKIRQYFEVFVNQTFCLFSLLLLNAVRPIRFISKGCINPLMGNLMVPIALGNNKMKKINK